MVDSQDSVERSLRFEAAKHLRGTENIRKALLWIRHNPEGFKQRIKEFDLICDDMSLLMAVTQDKERFGNVISLKEMLADNQLLKLNELTKGDKTTNNIPLSTIEDTFMEIDRLTKTGEWQFPNTITNNPNQLVTALLVEGYGLLLEKHFGKKGVGRSFVLSFEEVLWSKHKHSEMLKDVLPWMKEEAKDFSPVVAQEINQPQGS